jgi:hypothetical protein
MYEIPPSETLPGTRLDAVVERIGDTRVVADPLCPANLL